MKESRFPFPRFALLMSLVILLACHSWQVGGGDNDPARCYGDFEITGGDLICDGQSAIETGDVIVKNHLAGYVGTDASGHRWARLMDTNGYFFTPIPVEQSPFLPPCNRHLVHSNLTAEAEEARLSFSDLKREFGSPGDVARKVEVNHELLLLIARRVGIDLDE